MNETPELNAALAAAQGEFPAITKDKEVKTGSYSYKYAPLDAILQTCRPILARHGLAITQLLEDGDHGPGIRTELRHSAGGVIGASFPLPTMPQKAQELGSLLTYLRRYAIVALLGIAAEDDDDGAQAPAGPVKSAAGGQKRAPAARSQPAPSPAPSEPSEEQEAAFYTPRDVDERQVKRLQSLFRQKGIDDKEKRAAFASQAVGRTIKSSKELSYGETVAVIAQLAAYNPDDPETYPFPQTQLTEE